MVKSFEYGGIFYRLLKADAARWEPRYHSRPALPLRGRRQRRPAYSMGAEAFEEQTPAGNYESRIALLEEVEELRHRLAEAQRATEERKALFVHQLDKLRGERESLLARIDYLEGELSVSQQAADRVATRRASKVRRGLAATSGIAAATGVLQLFLAVRNVFSHRGRRPRLLRA